MDKMTNDKVGPWSSISEDALDAAAKEGSQTDKAKMSQEFIMLKAMFTVFEIKTPMNLLVAFIAPSMLDPTLGPDKVMEWWDKNRPSREEMETIKRTIASKSGS